MAERGGFEVGRPTAALLSQFSTIIPISHSYGSYILRPLGVLISTPSFKIKLPRWDNLFFLYMAERGGFEPPVPFGYDWFRVMTNTRSCFWLPLVYNVTFRTKNQNARKPSFVQ